MIHAPRQGDRHHAPTAPQPHSRRTPAAVAHGFFLAFSTSENPSPALTPTAPPTTLIHHHPRQSTETNARSLAPRSLAEMALVRNDLDARPRPAKPAFSSP